MSTLTLALLTLGLLVFGFIATVKTWNLVAFLCVLATPLFAVGAGAAWLASGDNHRFPPMLAITGLVFLVVGAIAWCLYIVTRSLNDEHKDKLGQWLPKYWI